MADGNARVTVLGPEVAHYWLVQRMAKATGVDLVRAMDAGVMAQEDWAAIVTRCRSCQWAEGCNRWLSAPVDEERSLPESCANRKRLARIKTRIEE